MLEEKTDKAYGIISQSRYKLDRGETVRGGRSLNTPYKRIGMYGHHSSSSSKRRHYSHHHHNPYRRREYLPKKFNKVKHPTFDKNMKKLEDAKALVSGTKKFFKLHSYSDNMKYKIATLSLKGEAYIWWEDVKKVKGIREVGMSLRGSSRSTYWRVTMMIKLRSFMSYRWILS